MSGGFTLECFDCVLRGVPQRGLFCSLIPPISYSQSEFLVRIFRVGRFVRLFCGHAKARAKNVEFRGMLRKVVARVNLEYRVLARTACKGHWEITGQSS